MVNQKGSDVFGRSTYGFGRIVENFPFSSVKRILLASNCTLYLLVCQYAFWILSKRCPLKNIKKIQLKQGNCSFQLHLLFHRTALYKLTHAVDGPSNRQYILNA